MSIKSAKAYVEKMKNDKEFREKILACTDAKKRMELVKADGFDFTPSDIKVVTAVLEEQELSNAAEGWNTGNCLGIGAVRSYGL